MINTYILSYAIYTYNLYYIRDNPKKINARQDFENHQLNSKAILAVLIESNSKGEDSYRFQTFTIAHNTTISEFKEGIISFWSHLKDRTNEFDLRYVDSEFKTSSLRGQDEEIINLFLKNKSNLSKAVFYYVSNKLKDSKYYILIIIK